MNPPDKKKQGERNPGASLQQKLRNHAKATGEDVALILVRYLNERFLYRLSRSPYRERFVLRGATLFTAWDAEPHRATRDIDLLALGESSAAALRQVIESVCAPSVGEAPVEEEDGLVFLTGTLHVEERTEGRLYQGLHLEMTALLGTARLRLEIDVAVGEAVVPPPQEIELPALLGKPAPRLRAYQKETAIAEKCQALVSLGMINTRMKDFYDLWYLSRAYEFDGPPLGAALRATFTRRETDYPAEGLPSALTDTFARDVRKQQQWRAFLGKAALRKGVAELEPVLQQVRAFLQPPLQALAEGTFFRFYWSPDTGWGDFTTRAHAALEEMTADAERMGLYDRGGHA